MMKVTVKKMKITILLFGILRDVIGESSLKKELHKGASLMDLRQELISGYTQLNKYKNYSIAVNEVYAEDDYILKENDVVALIPPVSGG